ncbi:MAG: LD-carboxypeptidase [Bacillota bacterium]|nr:LD-carboxypeptidase [Bacillota bacterium]
MIYPQFLQEKDTIGITALSKGVGGKLESFELSLDTLHQNGFQTIETANVRNDSEPSSEPKTRAQELSELVINPTVKAIWCAAGGDFQLETLPYINFEEIKKNPKWILGASDPTNLLFPVTTKLDIATIYGFNAGSFDEMMLKTYPKQCFNLLKGKVPTTKSSKKHQHLDYYNTGKPILNTTTKYIGECDVKGRMLGGCFESINDMAGTPFDHVADFQQRYKQDGIIWFFDVFAMESSDLYRALLKMKYMNYFDYTKAILVSRVLFERESKLISYQEAFKKACPDIPIIFETDIGHTYPHMLVINGALAHVQIKDGKGQITYKLK